MERWGVVCGRWEDLMFLEVFGCRILESIEEFGRFG